LNGIKNMITVQLLDGNSVPAICYGPGIMARGKKWHGGWGSAIINKLQSKRLEYNYYKSIRSAIDNGARFIDYSMSYGREDIVGRAIKDSGVKRSDFVITTRISNQVQIKGNIYSALLRSLERYDVGDIDLLMFHWPVPDKYVDTWLTMETIKEQGLCKTIGVANCHQHHIDKLINETGITPAINQIEVHPLLSQKELIKYCISKGIVVEAYTPLARMDERITRLPLMKRLCARYGKTMSQIILRWHIQNGVIPVFRSLNSKRQRENIDIFDFELSDEDMNAIDGININSRLRYDPDNCDFSSL